MYEVVGLKVVNFKDQRTGEQIDGLRVYATCQEDKVIGMATESFFFGRNKFGNLFDEFQLGGHFRVLYNKYGKPDDIEFHE